MAEAYICDYVRTPIGRYGGVLKDLRTDDLGAHPIRVLKERNPNVDWDAVDDCYYGCANQAGEDNRNVARMATLLAGLPTSVPGSTINRLCGSGLDAVGCAARAIRAGDADLMIAGGVESMTRAPFVMGKAAEAFSRSAEIYDTTIGWRFVNPVLKAQYGIDSMPETAENVAQDFQISRADQDAFALRSQQRTKRAQESGFFAREIAPVTIKGRKGDTVVADDEYIRAGATVDGIAGLRPAFKKDGSVTAANASGINDGAAALVIMRESTAKKLGCTPLARIVAHTRHSQEPDQFTTAPVGAIAKLYAKTGWNTSEVDLFEVNEAFAAVAMAAMNEHKIPHDKINIHGGACALGHPIGASGARIIVTLLGALKKTGGKRGVAALCIGGGEATAMAIEMM